MSDKILKETEKNTKQSTPLKIAGRASREVRNVDDKGSLSKLSQVSSTYM